MGTNNTENMDFNNFPPIGGLMVSKLIMDGGQKARFMYRAKAIREGDRR